MFRSILVVLYLTCCANFLHADEPVTVPPRIAAASVVLFVAQDGRVYASGDSESVRGDRSELARNHFLPIEGLEDIKSVYLPHDSCSNAAAIDHQSRVWVWGSDWNGYENPELSSKPRHLPELDGTVAMSLGSYHVITIDKDRRVRTLAIEHGEKNETGFLGTGDTQPQEGVVTVDGIDDAIQVAANYRTSYILRADGTVWGMGSGFMGMLGSNARQASPLDPFASAEKNANPRPIPIQGLRNIKSISISDRFCLALDKEGSVWGWGTNESGQLRPYKDDDYLKTIPPTRIRGLKPCIAISAGDDFMLAVQEDGTVMAQGCNVHGTLGDKRNKLSGRLRQVKLPKPVTRVYAGAYNAFAELEDGQFVGWGANAPGVGGFNPRALLQAIEPTQLDHKLLPDTDNEIIKAGGVSLVISCSRVFEAVPEKCEVFFDEKPVGKLVVNAQQPIDELRVNLPAGLQRYRITGTDTVDSQGLIFVSQGTLETRLRKSVEEKGLIAAIEDLKKEINTAIPNLTPGVLDLKSDGPLSEEEIQQCEKQFGKPLPKSYREALKTIGPFRLGSANHELPLVELLKPDVSSTISKWIDKALKGSQKSSDSSALLGIIEEIDLNRHMLDSPEGQQLRQQKLYVGAIVGYEPYLLSPNATACSDGSMSQLWPDPFDVDHETDEEWFTWTGDRQCELAMKDRLVKEAQEYVVYVLKSAGVTSVPRNPDGTVSSASLFLRKDGKGVAIDAD